MDSRKKPFNAYLANDCDLFDNPEDLVPGRVVSIYRNPRLRSKLEGKATLIERVEKGLSFILYDENLLTKLEERVTHEDGHHLPLTKYQRKRNRDYAGMYAHLIGVKRGKKLIVDEYLSKMYKTICKKVTKKVDNPKILYNWVEAYRQENLLDSSAKGGFFARYTNEQIIRFIQQTKIDKWSHSIWREETWIVSFDQDRFANPFRTKRKIRTLVCVSPKEDAQNSEILHFVTKGNTTISNADKHDNRDIIELEQEPVVGNVRSEESLETVGESINEEPTSDTSISCEIESLFDSYTSNEFYSDDEEGDGDL
jgi:hypothetical protein